MSFRLACCAPILEVGSVRLPRVRFSGYSSPIPARGAQLRPALRGAEVSRDETCHLVLSAGKCARVRSVEVLAIAEFPCGAFRGEPPEHKAPGIASRLLAPSTPDLAHELGQKGIHSRWALAPVCVLLMSDLFTPVVRGRSLPRVILTHKLNLPANYEYLAATSWLTVWASCTEETRHIACSSNSANESG